MICSNCYSLYGIVKLFCAAQSLRWNICVFLQKIGDGIQLLENDQNSISLQFFFFGILLQLLERVQKVDVTQTLGEYLHP